MTDTYFLGANSKDGFVSLYDEFPDKGAALHIIKAGPGSGKSSFMRRLGEAAEARGLDVHYVLCSGDPASLDGVYIPALQQAWVDGTAPHVIEPPVFAAGYDYVNLGVFCRTLLSDCDSEKATELNRSYKRLYARAYALLSAAAELKKDCEISQNGDEYEHEKEKLHEILSRHISADTSGGRIKKRFISAHSCIGRIVLKDSIKKLCKQIYVTSSKPELLEYAADYACAQGAKVILCPDPLCPSTAEAVLIPEYSAAFVSAGLGLEDECCRRLALCRDEESEARELFDVTMQLAYRRLAEAKSLHDELERIYRPYMGFKALDRYTEKVISELFN